MLTLLPTKLILILVRTTSILRRQQGAVLEDPKYSGKVGSRKSLSEGDSVSESDDVDIEDEDQDFDDDGVSFDHDGFEPSEDENVLDDDEFKVCIWRNRSLTYESNYLFVESQV